MSQTFGGPRGALLATALVGSIGIAGLAVFSPKYVLILVGGLVFVFALTLRPALGLAFFTLMTFFGELGHGASLAKAAGAILVLFWLLQIIRRDRRGAPFLGWTRPQIFYVAVGIVVWSVLSILWATDAGTAETTAFRLALNIMLFVVVPSFAHTRRDVLLILYAYVFGAALTAVYGIASGDANSDAAGRLGGGIGDPNELAALLVPAVVFAFLLLPMGRSLLLRVALLGSLGVSVLALVLAQSRGGVIAAAAAAAAAVVWGGRQRAKILFGIVVTVAGIASYILLASVALGRFSSFGGGGTGRIDTWSVALRMFRDHPILGVGIGNFTVVEPKYAAGNINLTRVDLVLDLQKVTHNTYLNILADLGLVGFVLFAALIVLVLRALIQRVREVEGDEAQLESIARGLLIALVGLLVAFTFISAQYEKQLWLLLGLGLAAANLRAGEREVEQPQPRPSTVRAVGRGLRPTPVGRLQ